MSAVVIPDEELARSQDLLAELRQDLGRNPGDTLHWKNIQGHSQRLHLAKTLAAQPWLTVSSVIVCKRHLNGPLLDEDPAYLLTLRYLLERLSWIARERGRLLRYTLAHIVRFKTSSLRAYEAELRAEEECQIAWPHLDPRGGHLDQPSRVEQLQLADAIASATGAAFNRDRFGYTEQRYLHELQSIVYRRGAGANALTSYGLKMHPWHETARAAYPWVAAL